MSQLWRRDRLRFRLSIEGEFRKQGLVPVEVEEIHLDPSFQPRPHRITELLLKLQDWRPLQGDRPSKL